MQIGNSLKIKLKKAFQVKLVNRVSVRGLENVKIETGISINSKYQKAR